jgi:hypothetical protein
MPSRSEVIVKRKAKDVGFLANEECPVYKKQFKEKCRNSCMQCNKNFKKAAYLRRHMQNIHAYKILPFTTLIVQFWLLWKSKPKMPSTFISTSVATFKQT